MDSAQNGTARTRERIVAAAVAAFAESGYNASTTRAIANAASVNEATLFRLFGSKQNLFETALIAKLASLHMPSRLLAEAADATSPAEGLKAAVRVVIYLSEADPEFVRMLQFASLEFGLRIAPLVRKHLGDTVAVVSACLRQHSATTLRAGDAERLIISCVAVVAALKTLSPILSSSEHGQEPLNEVSMGVLSESLSTLLSSEVAMRSAMARAATAD